MAKLDELESRLQALVEDQLMKYLPGRKTEDQIAQKLASAMQANLKPGDGGAITRAPNVYVLVAHPTTLTAWRGDARLLEELGDALQTVGEEIGLVFSTNPTLSTAADLTMPKGDIRILASFSAENVGPTAGMSTVTNDEGPAESIPSNAFLILHGTKIIPLNRSVINIGRRLDNQVVIDDPRVSRNHAQLRAIKERFVLFDLNSTGGTFVNGQPANQSILYPGDVISLAGVTIIFGQDLPTSARTRNGDITEPGSSISADRPTAVLKIPDEDDLK
ncbi:MAG: DUF3662 domain-containing protein [Anaerolineales bacterium]|nr:DUF3662 domain-containing protein [Anaerolineales bacterium]